MPCLVLSHSLYSLPGRKLGCQDSVPHGLGILKLGPLLTFSLIPAPYASAGKDLESTQGATSLASPLLHAGQGLPPCLQGVLQVGTLAWGHPRIPYTHPRTPTHSSSQWDTSLVAGR